MQRRWRPHPPMQRPPVPVTSNSDGNVYLVPPDSVGGSVRTLSSDEIHTLNAPIHSIAEIVAVASLLAKVPKFPLDVIDDILEFAGFVVCFEVESQEDRRGRNDMNEVYMELNLPQVAELNLPRGVHIHAKCVELVVECTSRDQGWASQNNEHDGTYAASYTWSEVAILKHEVDSTSRTEAVRTPITANVRATRQGRHHVKHFKDPTGLVGNIELGDSVQIILRSMYPGWTNSASYGRIRARFALDICEDAELMTWEQLRAYAQETGWSSDSAEAATGKCTVQ